MIVVVGLGNPGKNYEKTIHNLGYLTIDHFAKSNGLEFSKNKYFASVAEGMVDGEKVVLIKPETFMNASGKSVEACVNLLKLDTTNILVIVDDIDLDFGNIRVRTRGSAGTHNGMRDIVQKIGENFPRLRIGAGRPHPNQDLASYVLGSIPKDRLSELDEVFEKTDKVVEYFIKHKTIEGLDVNRI